MVAFASVSEAQSDQQPPLHLFQTPAKTRFGIFGQKPELPAPTILVLAMGADDIEKNRGYSGTGRQLVTEGWLYVTVDLPCHRRNHRDGEPEHLVGWAHRVKSGQELTSPFVQRCTDVLD